MQLILYSYEQHRQYVHPMDGHDGGVAMQINPPGETNAGVGILASAVPETLPSAIPAYQPSASPIFSTSSPFLSIEELKKRCALDRAHIHSLQDSQNSASTMSTSHYALSTSILGAPGRPGLKPSFGTWSVALEPKLLCPKKSSSRLRLPACSLGHLDHGRDVAFRNKELKYNIIKQRDPHGVEQKPSPSADLFHELSTSLQTLHTVDKLAPPPMVTTAAKPRVILLAGPTSVGKTRLSIELAKALGGEIINADSVQVYQGLDIGAAKATLEERQGVPHHLMDMIPPTEDYPYERFVTDARAATEDILFRGLVPIVIGGTGMYMRHFMHNRPGITSHPFDGEDLTGEFDDVAEWDYDFQAYFLYKHRADLFPRLDLRCEQQVVELLVETSAILDMGVKPHSNNAANAIGYEEAIDLLLEARSASGVVTEQRFMEFLLLFQHNCRFLAKKQTAWYRKTSRSDVRQFRWIQAGQPVQQMVDTLAREYQMPIGEESEVQPGSKDFMAASSKEQKRMQSYKPTLQIYSSAEAVASILRWIKSTQESK